MEGDVWKRGEEERERSRGEREEEGREKELELLLIILIKKSYIHVSPTSLQLLYLKGVLRREQWRDSVGFSYGSASVWIVTQIEPG